MEVGINLKEGINVKDIIKLIHYQLKELSFINGLSLGIKRVGFSRKCKTDVRKCNKTEDGLKVVGRLFKRNMSISNGICGPWEDSAIL